jgi:Tol biopolymer transport system component
MSATRGRHPAGLVHLPGRPGTTFPVPRRRGWLLPALASTALLGAALPAAAVATTPATTVRVSVGAAGAEANGYSARASLSGDGSVVAFASSASNLIEGGTSGVQGIFVRDRNTGITERASVSTTGGDANASADWPAVSFDGYSVAFVSVATNLVAVPPSHYQVYLRDRSTPATARTELVSVNSGGEFGDGDSQGAAISDNGSRIAFYSQATNLDLRDGDAGLDVYVRDLEAHTTTLVSVDTTATVHGNGDSLAPAISGNGRYVAFWSQATNLVAGTTGSTWGVYVRDLLLDKTERIDLTPAGAQSAGSAGAYGPLAISGDGRFVAFASPAADIVAADTDSDADVFVRDRTAGTTVLASVGALGPANAATLGPSISMDGRFVAFRSAATNLVDGDTIGKIDVFVRDLQENTTKRVSVSSTGEQANADCLGAVISAVGRTIAFDSEATNLVTSDGNSTSDVFVRELPELPTITSQGPEPVPDVIPTAGGATSGTRVPVTVAWSGSGTEAAIASYKLQRLSAGSWNTVPLVPATATSVRLTLTAGSTSYRFRVRATDTAGEVSDIATGPAFKISQLQETSSAIKWSGIWSKQIVRTASGGKLRYTTWKNASATITFTGRAIAWIAPTGPKEGKAKVYLDGRLIASPNLRGATRAQRVIAAASWNPVAVHRLKIVCLGTAGHPRVYIDAFVVIR